MLKKFINLLRKGAEKIGILKYVKELDELEDVAINDEMYDLIEQWKALYRGYYPDWHDVTYHTIEGFKSRRMDTLNMAKTSAAEMASLVFNEKCEISIGDNENETAEFVFDVFKRNKFNKKFQDYLEYMFAHGGMVMKPYVQDGQIKISFVTADCFIPISWQNDTIKEAVFINETRKGKKYYTLLEWHVWENGVYTVKNELYESENANDLGRPTTLDTLYPNLDAVVGFPKLEKPLFVYFKPNTANNFDTQSPLGISLYANALSIMKAIDTAFDSLHREFRLGKKRIFVPDSMVKVVYDQDGRPHRYFDPSDEVYQSYPGDMDETTIHDVKVELRVEEHIAAINAMLNIFAMQTGFSTGTFTFDGQSVKTATEVVSENSKTFKSKQSHEVIIEAGLIELIESILALAELYGLHSANIDDLEISISFDDSVAEDKNAEIDKQIKLVNAELTSRKRAIMKVLGVTEEEALEILQEIIEEQRMGAPDLRELQAESVLFGDRE